MMRQLIPDRVVGYDMKKKLQGFLVLQVVKSTAIIAVTLFVMTIPINWTWISGQYNSSMQESMWFYFERSMINSSLFIGVQIAVIFAAYIFIALHYGQHKMFVRSLSGFAVLALNAIATGTYFHHNSKAAGLFALLVTPLLLTMLQLWSKSRENPVDS